VRGTIDADTERGARNQLRGRGLLPLSTALAARAEGLGASLRTRLSDADLAWLTRQLASLLAARLPLDAALSATLEQAEKKTYRRHAGQRARRRAGRPSLVDRAGRPAA